MSLFSKYCKGDTSDAAVPPEDEKLPFQFNAGRRTSVSAECSMHACEPYHQSPQDARQSHEPMTTSQARRPAATNPLLSDDVAYRRVADALRKNIIFSELNDDLIYKVISALERQSVPANHEVITQGNEGDCLYLLEDGKVEFTKDGKPVGVSEAWTIFGELVLLYNSPRAATVRTVEPSHMFKLDRMIFKRIMVAKFSRKRQHSQQVLAQIDVFSKLPMFTQLKIADSLQPRSYGQGDVVIRQGDQGSEFFLIDEGTVEITADGKRLNSLSSGSYFGELALIYDLPRAASVTATSPKLKLEALSKHGFEQLIGPDLVAELRKRDPRKDMHAN